MDTKDDLVNDTKVSAQVDMVQYYLNLYSKQPISKENSFGSLYCYMLKILHPLSAICSNYKSSYSRKIGVVDFFLKISSAFVFGLINLYNNSLKASTPYKESEYNFTIPIAYLVQYAAYVVIGYIGITIIMNCINYCIYSNTVSEDQEDRAKALQRSAFTRKQEQVAEIETRRVDLSDNMIQSSDRLFRNSEYLAGQRRSLDVSGIIKHNDNSMVRLKDGMDNSQILSNEFQKVKNTEIQFLGKSPTKIKRNNFNLFSSGSRNYAFRYMDNRKEVSCTYISYFKPEEVPISVTKRNSTTCKSFTKFFIEFLLLIVVWLGILLMIGNINYYFGPSTTLSSVIMLAAAFFAVLGIFSLLQAMIATALMHNSGNNVYNKKGSCFTNLLFYLFVDVNARNNHQSLLTHRAINNALKSNGF